MIVSVALFEEQLTWVHCDGRSVLRLELLSGIDVVILLVKIA